MSIKNNSIKLDVKVKDFLATADYKDDKCTVKFRKIDALSKFEFTGKVSSRRVMRVMIKQVVKSLSDSESKSQLINSKLTELLKVYGEFGIWRSGFGVVGAMDDSENIKQELKALGVDLF